MLRQGLRFLAVGAFNTAMTYGLYCVLVIWWHPQLAWIAIYLFGLALGYYTHSRLVFAAPLGQRKALGYALVQLTLYALSSGVIYVSMHLFDLGPRLAGAVAVAMNVPISFLASRHILHDRPAKVSALGMP